MHGEKGTPGQDGKQGIQGVPGLKGKHGDPGKQGQPGEHGDPGKPGVKGDRGLRGEDGKPGPEGESGPQGEKGDKGDSGIINMFFFGKQIIEWLAQSMTFSCYFDNETSGIISEGHKRVGIKNQVHGKDAMISKGVVGKMIKLLHGQYALELSNNTYIIKDVTLTGRPSF